MLDNFGTWSQRLSNKYSTTPPTSSNASSSKKELRIEQTIAISSAEAGSGRALLFKGADPCSIPSIRWNSVHGNAARSVEGTFLAVAACIQEPSKTNAHVMAVMAVRVEFDLDLMRTSHMLQISHLFGMHSCYARSYATGMKYASPCAVHSRRPAMNKDGTSLGHAPHRVILGLQTEFAAEFYGL